MVFLWKSGEQLTLDAGSNVRGLIRNHKRPHKVELTRKDLFSILNNTHATNYLMTLRDCLDRENENDT